MGRINDSEDIAKMRDVQEAYRKEEKQKCMKKDRRHKHLNISIYI